MSRKDLDNDTDFNKSFVLLIIVLLSGGSVAVAGPIGFIGIVTPHLLDLLLELITDGDTL